MLLHTCWGLFYCSVNESSALYLSTPWLLKHVLLSTHAVPHFPTSPSFILLLHLSASWEVCMWVRDGLWMESSADSGQALHLPHRYSAHILPNVYFHCDFFSPFAPFLCLTCISSLNLYGWLDNFTVLLTPKGPPETKGLTRCSSAHSFYGSSEVLI